jgi:hypothetical protein
MGRDGQRLEPRVCTIGDAKDLQQQEGQVPPKTQSQALPFIECEATQFVTLHYSCPGNKNRRHGVVPLKTHWETYLQKQFDPRPTQQSRAAQNQGISLHRQEVCNLQHFSRNVGRYVHRKEGISQNRGRCGKWNKKTQTGEREGAREMVARWHSRVETMRPWHQKPLVLTSWEGPGILSKMGTRTVFSSRQHKHLAGKGSPPGPRGQPCQVFPPSR